MNPPAEDHAPASACGQACAIIDEGEVRMQPINRRTLISMLPMTLLAAVRATAQEAVTVYKDPSCGCCTKWVDLLRREGFAVTVKDITELGQKSFAPSSLHGCHTAI